MSDSDRQDVENQIIQATIACIEESGLEGATTRRIAERAGVNSAAINYYFRTKDRLIERALDITLDNAFDWSDFATSEQTPPQQRLIAILDDLIAGALAYPGLSRAHFHDVVIRDDYSGTAVRRLNEFAEQLHADLVKRGLELSPQRLRTALVQIFASSLVFVALVPNLLKQFADIDLRDPGVRRSYVQQLVAGLIR